MFVAHFRFKLILTTESIIHPHVPLKYDKYFSFAALQRTIALYQLCLVLIINNIYLAFQFTR